MDMNKIMSLAKKNQSKASIQKRIGYSTEVKPAKKLERTVNPDAIKSFLNKKKEMEKMQMEIQLKKKQHLQKLREDTKHTKRAKAMATRTKDNMKILYNQKPLQQSRSEEVVLSPEAEKQHKAFMKNLIASEIHNDASSESDEEGGNIEAEKKALKKTVKYQKKARQASNLGFHDLLNLAQEQTQNPSSDSSKMSSSSDEEISSEEMSVQERFEKEKRRRKEVEAQLKALKRKNIKNSESSSVYKIGKLDKGLTEEDKRVKVKALMEKFKSHSQMKNGVRNSKSKTESQRTTLPAKQASSKVVSHSSSKFPSSQKIKLSHSKPSNFQATKSKINTNHAKNISQPNIASSKTKHLAKSVSKPSVRSSIPPKVTQKTIVKRASNPYAELMQKAKLNNEERCTLSVTNSVVRTNYPGVSQTDPKRPKYQKVAPSQEMIEAYRRRKAMKTQQQPPYRRPHVIQDSDDEYDSEMEGFIDDEDEDIPDSISAEIGKIFRYDKSKYGKESEYELSKMDASFRDIEREEKRSLRIAQQEDAIEAKRLAEEEMKKRKRMKK